MGPGPAHGGELRAKAALADEVPQAATPRSQVCAAAGTSLSRNRHAKKSVVLELNLIRFLYSKIINVI